jgi:TRAP-type transport system periplasmic protein
MLTIKKLLILAFAALWIAALADIAPAQTKFRFGHTLNTEDSGHLGVVEFAKRVEQKTAGAIRVEIFPAGQLGTDPQVLDGAKLGTIDMSFAGNPFFSSFAPELNVFDLPYLFRDKEHAYKVYDGPIAAELLKAVERSGLKALGTLELGFRNLTNNKRPVKKPDDLKGLKIRTTPNPAHILEFRLLGANPVAMPWTEVYLALKTGTVDGMETPTPLIYSTKIHEVQKHMSLIEHSYTALNVVMNLRKFQELKPEHQQALVASMSEALTWQRKVNNDLEGQAIKAMRASGMQIEEQPDREAFRKIVADPTAEEYVKRFGRETLTKIRNVR